MKKSFIHPEFMLDTKTASKLYHTYAESLPIIDYHCHIPPRDVAEDRKFENLTRIWLAGDHYKWRAMRASGIDEYYITGQASDWEKFEMWAMTVPKMIRNPLYHWTHLELNRPFGINNMLLSEKTAKAVWEKCNVKLSTKDFTAQGILKKMNVEIVCTTDDPIDSLEFHQSYAKLKNKTASTKLVPAWRPDKAMAAEDADSFNVYIGKLEAAANYEIKDFASLIQALRIRHAYFHDHGCRLSDHGIETAYADDYTESQVVNIFKRVRRGKMLDAEEIAAIVPIPKQYLDDSNYTALHWAEYWGHKDVAKLLALRMGGDLCVYSDTAGGTRWYAAVFPAARVRPPLAAGGGPRMWGVALGCSEPPFGRLPAHFQLAVD